METMLVTRPVRVVLADDHPMIRRGLRLILEDSDERTEHPEQTERDSVQTPD